MILIWLTSQNIKKSGVKQCFVWSSHVVSVSYELHPKKYDFLGSLVYTRGGGGSGPPPPLEHSDVMTCPVPPGSGCISYIIYTFYNTMKINKREHTWLPGCFPCAGPIV